MKLQSAIEKHDGQLALNGKAQEEIKAEVKALAQDFQKSITEIAQKMENGKPAEVISSAGEEFVSRSNLKQSLQVKCNALV